MSMDKETLQQKRLKAERLLSASNSVPPESKRSWWERTMHRSRPVRMNGKTD